MHLDDLNSHESLAAIFQLANGEDKLVAATWSALRLGSKPRLKSMRPQDFDIAGIHLRLENIGVMRRLPHAPPKAFTSRLSDGSRDKISHRHLTS